MSFSIGHIFVLLVGWGGHVLIVNDTSLHTYTFIYISDINIDISNEPLH